MISWPRCFSTLVLLAAVFAATASPAQPQSEPNPPRLITVTGEGEVSVEPDLAVLTAGVTTTAKTAREASQANAKAMSAVMAAVKKAGIAAGDVQTARLSLQPQRENRYGSMQITGFQASNQVTINIRDLGKISELLDNVVAAGANDISGIQFVVSSPSSALDQARAAAIADARRKAEIYARAATVRLGAPVSISEQGSTLPRPLPMRSLQATSTPISPGEETLHVSVTVRYELLP
jgi:uncharacterized protein